PHVLLEWGQTDNTKLILDLSESRQTKRDRVQKQEHATRLARELLKTFDCLESTWLVAKVFRGRALEEISRAEWADMRRRLDEVRDCLAKVASPEPTHSFREGQPRKYTPYLVLQDAAPIFEWYTGTKPTREVDRVSHKETGPFFHFVSTLWPVLFGNRSGLIAAMKNWEHARKHYGERSALIGNIALRHPTWGIFTQ